MISKGGYSLKPAEIKEKVVGKICFSLFLVVEADKDNLSLHQCSK
jgi:hypothetical protein